MKHIFYLFLTFLFLASCQTKNATVPIVGTWQLISGTIIEKGDTTIIDYTKNQKVIKIINETHFSFLRHDLTKGKDSLVIFASGGGAYTLTDNTYTENLEYCNYREW